MHPERNLKIITILLQNFPYVWLSEKITHKSTQKQVRQTEAILTGITDASLK